MSEPEKKGEPVSNDAPVIKADPVSSNGAAGKSAMSATQKMILGFGSVATICATVVAVVVLTKPAPIEAPAPEPAPERVITAENVDQITREVKEKVDKGMFETHMNTTWKFSDGSSASYNAVMGNSAANNYDFYFTVTLPDTGETIFTSGLIPVGSTISEIVLDRDLDPGVYQALVGINMVDENGEDLGGNTGINVTLQIEG